MAYPHTNLVRNGANINELAAVTLSFVGIKPFWLFHQYKTTVCFILGLAPPKTIVIVVPRNINNPEYLSPERQYVQSDPAAALTQHRGDGLALWD